MATVLLPCNGSPNAMLAVRHVVDAYRRGEVTAAHLLNVQPPLSQYVARHVRGAVRREFHRERGERALASARRLLGAAGVPYQVHLAVGDAAGCAADMARRCGCQRVVIGTSRKSAVVRALENSMTARLIEICPVPVVVVSGAAASALERVGLPAGVGAGMALLWVGMA